MAMLSFERKYRVRGGTLIGGDLFDFWVGPFYVGFFGVTTIVLRRSRHRADRLWRGDRPDLERLADQHRAAGSQIRPGVRAAEGRRPVADHHDLRDRLLCLLGAARGRDLPQARHRLSCAVRLRLRDLRLCLAGRDPPGADGGLGLRISLWDHQPSRLGVEHRLPVSALPLQSGAHAGGDVLLHDGVCAGAARLADPVGGQSRQGRGGARPTEHENTFFRDTIGYSIGTLGIHRLGLFLALSAVFWSAVCIIISGPFWTRGWPEWWNWWLNLPIWR